jgi:hypothetical protein
MGRDRGLLQRPKLREDRSNHDSIWYRRRSARPDNIYFSWYQMSPGVPFGGSISPHPGDVITASMTCSPCSGSQSWTLSMTDLTSGDVWSQPVPYQSSGLSAEFIEGTSADQLGIFPLANYDTITFDQSLVDSTVADLDAGYGIVLRAPQGNSSNLSPLNDTDDGFTACYGPHKTLTPCSFIPLP